MNRISQVTISSPDELADLSDSIREIADRIDNGEVLAMSYCLTLREDKFETNWVKAKGVSKLSMLGAAQLLVVEMIGSVLED